MKFDLHCHSSASDGKLSPKEVLALAVTSGVQLFALTDHDTLQGYEQLALMDLPFVFVPGIELSAVWSGVAVHVVGLDIEPGHTAMTEAIAFLRHAREARARVIDARLAAKGMPDTLQGALSYCPDIGQVGRPHFARCMVDKGYVQSVGEAFERWLGSGKLGDVKTGWPSMEQAVGWILQAGGVAVLAHPLRYDMTFSKMRRLVSAFCSAGGQAIELSGQQASADQKRELQKLAVQAGLAGSGGSDFHDPGWAWAQIGRIEPLPDSITPVWELFRHTPVVLQNH